MGCPATRESVPHEKDHEFVILMKRLTVQFQQETAQLTQKVVQLKTTLRMELNKPLGNRSRETEYGLLLELTTKVHLKAIYEFLALQCQFVLDRQRFVPVLFSNSIASRQEAESKLSVRRPIEVVLFSVSVVSDGRESVKNADLAKFSRIVGGKFRGVSEPMTVEHELLNYYKNNPVPNTGMVREIAFEFCQEENLPISDFHAVGLNFKY